MGIERKELLVVGAIQTAGKGGGANFSTYSIEWSLAKNEATRPAFSTLRGIPVGRPDIWGGRLRRTYGK